MSVDNTDLPVESTPTPTQSPGRLIASAREAAALSPADLAVRLRLDTKVIKALERDDFENLPAPLFVKGYINSIAKELGIGAGPILAAYTAHAELGPPSLADFTSRPPEQIGLNSAAVKLVTYGLIALLLVLIGIWWHGAYDEGDEASTRAEIERLDREIAATEPLPYEFEIVTHDDHSWRNAAPPPIDESAEPDDELVAAAPDEFGIVISTSNEAWVEIYDAENLRRYFGMLRADKTVEVAGSTNYRVVIGNAESATLRFNGTNIDLAPFSNQGVAQLNLPLDRDSEASAQ